MAGFVNAVKSAALGVAESFTPILTESKFRETGVLMPEEFVAAGDHLVYSCPTWSWSTSSDPSKNKDYLPADKQFLTTKNVPCYRRCRDMEYDAKQEKVLVDENMDDNDGGWVDTHHYAPSGTTLDAQVADMSLGKSGSQPDNSGSNRIELAKEPTEDDDDEPAVDMDDFIDSGALEEDDPNALDMNTVVQQSGSTTDETSRLSTRTYDLNITYDKYYQVPRLWLVGYDEKRKPLNVERMYEDFSADHANKTITMETHPNISGPPMASVHPCRHAETMKRLIEQLAESGKDLGVHQYLLIFLKFMQAVIPTIEYDYTRSIQL